MNNMYHWQDERMVQLEMREVDRAVEQARLLREAGLAGASWLARAVEAIRNLRVARGKRHQDHDSVDHPFFQAVNHRLAP